MLLLVFETRDWRVDLKVVELELLTLFVRGVYVPIEDLLLTFISLR